MDLFNRKKVRILQEENERLKKKLIEWIGTQNRPQYEPSPEALSHFARGKEAMQSTLEEELEMNKKAVRILMTSNPRRDIIEGRLRYAGLGIKITEQGYTIFKL